VEVPGAVGDWSLGEGVLVRGVLKVGQRRDLTERLSRRGKDKRQSDTA
jgi:hypothetical protein